VDNAPPNLQKRHVEITAPPFKKEIVNAVNSGANVFMADFEDAFSPTWPNVLMGHHNLLKAIRQSLRFYDPERRKEYSLDSFDSQIFIRPRSLQKEESHIWIDGLSLSASMFDVAVYAFNNAQYLSENYGSTCYFYLPKIDFMEDAQLWDKILGYIEREIGVEENSFKVTVIVESVSALFELDEIIFILRKRIVGLNAGRWNYLASLAKRFKFDPSSQLQPRNDIETNEPYLQAFNQQIVHVAHKRGLHAIGGASNFTARFYFPKATKTALEKVKEEKFAEAHSGFDGSWVVHPMLVETA